MFSNKNIKEELLTKQNILKYVSEYQIYSYYLGSFKIGGNMHSPFREDNNPSFGIFIGKYGDLAYNDYKLGGGDCISFVARLEKVSYYQAMILINDIFDLNLVYFGIGNSKLIRDKSTIQNIDVNKIKKKKPKFYIKRRKWNEEDVEYFSPLAIKKLNVIPIQFYWVDEQMFNTEKLAYAWRYGKCIYKIYQPTLETKQGKWWTNIDNNVQWFGHNLLPKKGDLLFVCSSNKDAEVLLQCNYNAIAPHTEAQMFSEAQYKEYSKRFKRIIIFYDNDETGILKAERFSNKYDLEYIALEEPDTKDPFEFIKKYNLKELKLWISQWI